MKQKINYSLADSIRKKKPIIHCITNYVTAGDVANAILACGASPIMADHPEEVKEVTALSNCLVLNMGTPKINTKEAMLLAGKEASQLNHPVILDPVGIGTSIHRTETILSIIKEVKLTVLRGNVSELKFLLHALTQQDMSVNNDATGIDVSPGDQMTDGSMKSLTETAKALSAITGSVVVMTGTTDIVSTWEETWLIKNGSPKMAMITGCGCMLGGILASYVSAACFSGSIAPKHKLLEAAALATAAAGVCGEAAEKKAAGKPVGTGSFHCFFLDEISLLSESKLKGGAHIEFT